MQDKIFMDILDQNGCPREVPFLGALARERERAIAEEAALGIKRDQIPFIYINLPDTPQTPKFILLAQAIRTLASFDFIPENNQQRYWMRCVQLYWQAKAILLSQKIFNLIPNLADLEQQISQMLPETAFKNLQLETDAEKAVYDLIVTGEPLIRDWAKNEGIDYPFQNSQDLFLRFLKDKFQSSLSEIFFKPEPLWLDKRKQRAHYRQWLKFFADQFTGEPKEFDYLQFLKEMEWEGYWILALWKQKNQPAFKKLWQAYLKTQRKLVTLFDSDLHWRKAFPTRLSEPAKFFLLKQRSTKPAISPGTGLLNISSKICKKLHWLDGFDI